MNTAPNFDNTGSINVNSVLKLKHLCNTALIILIFYKDINFFIEYMVRIV